MKKNIKIVIVFISLMILCIAAYISLPKITYALEGKINDAIHDTISAIATQTNLNAKKFEIREHRGYGIIAGGAGSGEVVSYEGAPSYTGGHTSSAGYQGIKDIQSYLDTYLNDAYNWDLGWLASLKYNTSIYCREYGRTFPGVARHYLGMFHQIGNYNQLGGSYDANNDHLGAKVIDYVEKLAERACQHKITVAPQDWDKEGIEMKTEPISERDVIFAREGGSYIQITAVRLKYTKVQDLTFDTAESYIYSFNKRKYYNEDPAQQSSWIYHADDNVTAYGGAGEEGLKLYRAALAVQDLSDPTKPEMGKSTLTEGTLTYSTGTVIEGDYYKVGPIYMNDYQYGWSENVRDISGQYSLDAPENADLISHMTDDQKTTFKGLIAGIVEAKVELDNGETIYLNDTNFGYYEQDTAKRDFVDSDCYYESPAKHGYDYPTPNSKFYIKLPIEDCEGATKVSKITMKYRWLTGEGKGGFLQGYFDNLFWEGKKNFNYEGCTYECTNTQSDGDQCQNDGLIWSDRSAFPGWDYDVHLKKHTFKCGGTGYCKNGSRASVIYSNDYSIPDGIPSACRTLSGDAQYNCGNTHTSHDKGACWDCSKSGDLICSTTPHTHGDSCYHKHKDNCYDPNTMLLVCDSDGELTCTTSSHAHTDSCYHDCSDNRAACCTRPIHTHSISSCGLVHPCEKNYCDHGFSNGNHTCGVKDEHSHSTCGRSWGKDHIGDCYGKEGEDSESQVGTFCPDHGAGIHKSCYEFDWIVIKEDFDVRSQNLMYVEEAHVYENQIDSTIEEIPLVTRVEIDKFIYDVEHSADYVGAKDNTYKAGDDRKELDEKTKEGNPVYVETDDYVTYKIVLRNYSAFGVKVKVDDILPVSTAYEFDKAQCGTWETNDLATLRDYLIPIAAGSESSPSEATVMIRLQVKALEGKYENKARIITRNDSPKVPGKEEDIDYIRTTDDDGPIVNHIETECNGTKDAPEWESSDWFMLNNYNAFIDKYVYSYNEIILEENNDLGISEEKPVTEGEENTLIQKVGEKDVSRRNLTKTTKEVSDGNVMDIIRTDDKAKETYKGQHPVNVEQGEKITYAIRVSNEAKEIPKDEPTGTKPATQLKNLRIEDIMHEGLVPDMTITGKIFDYVDGVNDTLVKTIGGSLSGSNGKYYITALSGEDEVLEPDQYVEFYINVDVVQSNMYLPSMENSAELISASNINDVTIFDRDGGVDRMISEQTASKEFVRMKDLLIAGYVWLDFDQDGLMNDTAEGLQKVNNNVNENAMKEDVIVRLYRVEGDVDTTTGMAIGKEIRRTKTDENGLYTFARAEGSSSWYDTFNHTVDYKPDGTAVNDVRYQRIDKADGKDEFGNYTEGSKYYSYYVEFEYDGVLYRSTEIYADNKNLNSDGSFKSEEYTVDSNAMELKADREEFNNRYEYISYNVAYNMNMEKDPNGSDLVFQKDGHSSYLMEDPARDMTAKSFITKETEKIKLLWLYNIDGNKDATTGHFYPKTDYLKYINLGLELREDVDLALTKDVYNLKTTVNGEEMEYDFNLGDTTNFLNDYIVKKPYGFEIYESDYKYRVEQYITKAVEAYKGINGEDELNIEITYRINLQNLTTKDDEEMAALEPDNPEVNKNTPLYARVHEILDLYDENFMELTGNDEDDTVDLKVKNEEGFLEDKTIKVAEAWMFMTEEEAGDKELLEKELQEDGTYKVKKYKTRKASDGTNTSNNDIFVEDPTGDYVKVKLEMSHVSSRGENGVFSAKENNFKDDGYNTAYIRGMEDQVIPEGGSINIYVKYVVDKDKLEITVDEDYETTKEITKEAYTWNEEKETYEVIEIKDENFKAKAIISEIFKETITEGETTKEINKTTIERALKLKDHKAETNEFKSLYGRGTENIAQIDAYSVWYDEAGTVPASLVDKDSNAGNIGIKNTSTNASPNGSGYGEEPVSADNVEYYEDTTYKTGIELAAEGTEQTREEIETTYDSRIPEVDRIIEITAEYDLIRKITGKVWDDSRSTTLGSGNEIQYVANGMYSTFDTKIEDAKDNKNVTLNYKDNPSKENEEDKITEKTDIAVRNAKAEFIEIIKIPRTDGAGNYILDADGNKQFDYYEEVLTNVTWDQVQNVRTGENGEYTLEGFKPGRYIVRFTYGDVNEDAKTVDGSDVWDKIKEFDDRIEALSERTDLTTEKAIYDEKEKILAERNQLLDSDPELLAVKDMLIFNGQDYKSTKYTGVQDDPTLKEDEVIDAFQKPNNSDARDDEVRRLEVNAYSEVMTNEMAEILKGLVNGNKTYTPNSTANSSTELKALTDNTYMKADTVEFLIKPEKLIETETIKQKLKYETEYKYDPNLPYYKYLTALKTEHIKERDFTIENVDFGIEYRPESQISLMKEIKEITLKTTAKNGESDILVNLHFTTEGDGENRTHKIIEEDSIGYELVQFITNNYTDKTLINNVMSEESLQGLVYIQVDEEVLQGCTIEITYGFDAQNNSEVDRISKQLNAIRYRDNKATDDLITSYNTKYAGQAHKEFSIFDFKHIQNTKYTASALSKAAVFADTFALDDEGIVYREIPKTTTTDGTDGYYGRFVGHGYYIGEESDLDTISSLKFDKILDYIDTNLEYEQKTNAEEMTNKLWSKIDSGELVGLVSYYKGIRNSINGLTFNQVQEVKNEFTNKLKENEGAFTTSVTVNDKVIELERKITDGHEELFVDDIKFAKVTNMDGIEYKSMVVSVDDRNVDPGDPNDTGDVKNKDLSKFLLPKVSVVGWNGEDLVGSADYEKYTGHIYLDVSKVLAAGSDADDKTYENMAEIVQFTTLNGRRTNFATTIGNADIKAIKEKLDNNLPPFESVDPSDPKNPGSVEFITASIEPDTSATETITLIPPTGLMRSRRPIAYIMEATKTGVEVMSMVGLVVAIVLAIGAVVVYTARKVQRRRIK